MSTQGVISASAVTAEPARPTTQDVVDIDRDIELVLSFLNTCDAEAGTDVLDDGKQWQQWCADRGWAPVPDTAATYQFRQLMRASATCVTGFADPRVDPGPEWPVSVKVNDGFPVIAAHDAVGDVLAAASRLTTTGHWERIKICPAEDCLWAFYDRSRNRSRTWCSMRVCGNREKARSWRERHVSS